MEQRFKALKTAARQRKSDVCVLRMFVLLWCQRMISSEDVNRFVCVCIHQASWVEFLLLVSWGDIDLPQRRTLVPGSPAASTGPGDRQQGEIEAGGGRMC